MAGTNSTFTGFAMEASKYGRGTVIKQQPYSSPTTRLPQPPSYEEEGFVTFKVNGTDVTIDPNVTSVQTSLARFLRSELCLTGTKIMCQQAGCGACVVQAVIPDPASGQAKTRSVNSCITPVYKCHGWEVTTVEGLGNAEAPSVVQQSLAEFNGTQCGFCSPGMVMFMDSLLKGSSEKPSMETIEGLLDGNICRCTGYRPILDAFKSFAVDAPPELKKKLSDIEDLVSTQGRFNCPKTNAPCQGACSSPGSTASKVVKTIRTNEGEWMKATSLDHLMSILQSFNSFHKYRLVAGNTGTGIFNNDGPYQTFIDITGVSELLQHSMEPFYVGGGVCLTDFIELLERKAKDDSRYFYANQMAAHLKYVANTNVRNVGSIAGNLMLKHAHSDGPSDVFNLLEAVGAEIVVQRAAEGARRAALESFRPSTWLKTSMAKAVVVRITLPKLTQSHRFMTYKITPRSQNAYPYVNAAFLAKVDQSAADRVIVVEKPTLVFGGIGAGFFHAEATETILAGKNLKSNATLKEAMDSLAAEVHPSSNPVLAEPEYRVHLTQALLYKFILTVLDGNPQDPLDSRLRSGGYKMSRGVSKGCQSYTVDEAQFPINQPINKLEARIQCTGQAEYTDDIGSAPAELFGAFVLAEVGNADLDVVNAKPALAMPGVVDYIDHEDVPGRNSAISFNIPDTIFIKRHVEYAGQAVGLIVADSPDHARRAAKAVEISYKNKKTPIVKLKEALADKTTKRVFPIKRLQHKGSGGPARAATTVEGEVEIGSQYHFHMETHACLVTPIEGGDFEIWATTQDAAAVQANVADCLDIQMNKVTINVRRLGGAYGGKIVNPNRMISACAVAANKLNKPVRIVMNLEDTMKNTGKRAEFYATYRASIDENDKLTNISVDIASANGSVALNLDSVAVREFFQNCYSSVDWDFKSYGVKINTPLTTPCRAPSSTQGHAIMETIMEHLAHQAGLDPINFRMKNILAPGDHLMVDDTIFEYTNPLPDMVDTLKISSEYESRKRDVGDFNKANAWKKRGLAFVPLRWPHRYSGFRFTVQLSVYTPDGTIALSPGGIEMGQGLNTKVAQVVAKELGVPLDMISVKKSDTVISNNNVVTGGSTGSDLCCAAASVACANLLAKMAPAVAELPQDATWMQKVKECDKFGVDLSARHTTWPPGRNGTKGYDIWGVCLTEVELDLLTGEKMVRRADIVEDTGVSLSPEIDIGQIEGAFVMSLGLWMTEQLKYDPETGQLLTHDTWEYKPPVTQDIPEDLRTTLYKIEPNANTGGVYKSKATGEPPFLLGYSAILALRNALVEAKKETGQDFQQWFPLHGPATNERLHKVSGVAAKHFYVESK